LVTVFHQSNAAFILWHFGLWLKIMGGMLVKYNNKWIIFQKETLGMQGTAICMHRS
jgi:hypothetical protein